MGNDLKANDRQIDPTEAPEFKRVLGNMLKMPPKPQKEMKAARAASSREAKARERPTRSKTSGPSE